MALTRMDYYLSSIYELGGIENYIHEDEVYELMWKKNRAELSWRTKDYPHFKKCDSKKVDAVNKFKYVLKQDEYNIKLTPKGKKYVEDKNLISVETQVQEFRVEASRKEEDQIKKIIDSKEFNEWTESQEPINALKTKIDLFEILKILPDANIRIFKEKIQTLISVSGDIKSGKVKKFLEQTLSNLGE